MGDFSLRLYITGKTPKSERTVANLKEICEKVSGVGQYQLRIIDVLESPHLAENEKILATPTLVKDIPPPTRRIIGDLSNAEKVLLGLDLLPAGVEPCPASE